MSRKRRHEEADASSDAEDVFVYYEHTELASIPRGITSLRIDKSVKTIPPGAFREQNSLTKVEYEEGLQVIGEEAFMFCVLREQRFPSTLIEIGKNAFRHCNQLRSLGDLPQSLITIRDNAFSRCRSLEKFEFDITNNMFHLGRAVFNSCYNLSHVKLPRGMLTIPEELFYDCASLVDVEIPPSVTEIGNFAFCECKSLSLIAFSKGLKTIGYRAFDRTAIVHFDCPETVESIDRIAFWNCQSLKSAVLPPKLEVISERTFDRCRNLEEIKIPQSVVRIQNGAFAGCYSLKNVIFPRESRLKRIEERTFEDCHSLTHLWLPPTVEYVGDGAIDGCRSLLSVEVPEALKQIVFVSRNHASDPQKGYRSLVNLYLPPSHQLDTMEGSDFLSSMKLGEAESNYPALVDKLKRRFDNLPLHRLCYFQSYHSLQETITQIRTIVNSDPSAMERVDFLGMTPFHILALSKRPWLNIFQELLSVSSSFGDIIRICQDVFGSTPLDYLCKNVAAAGVTKSLLLHVMERRISFLGLGCWRDDMLSDLDEMQMADASALPARIRSIRQKLSRLERREVLSLLEMSMWKMKIKATDSTFDADDRESCRIDCGSEIVIPNVLPLLETVTHLDDEDDEDSEDEIEDEESSEDDGDY